MWKSGSVVNLVVWKCGKSGSVVSLAVWKCGKSGSVEVW